MGKDKNFSIGLTVELSKPNIIVHRKKEACRFEGMLLFLLY